MAGEPTTHADLLREAMDKAKDGGILVSDFAGQMNISAVYLYKMINDNYVPPWYWPKVEQLTERAIRQEDFLHARYNKPKNAKSRHDADT